MGPPNALVKDRERYKTKICESFAKQGSCAYGRKCQFAHGAVELLQRASVASTPFPPPPPPPHPLPKPLPPPPMQRHEKFATSYPLARDFFASYYSARWVDLYKTEDSSLSDDVLDRFDNFVNDAISKLFPDMIIYTKDRRAKRAAQRPARCH